MDDYKLVVDMSSETHPDTVSETEDEQPNNENDDEPSRRSTRQRRPPDFNGREQNHLTTETPTTFMDANANQDRAKWKAAVETEMKYLEESEVWNLVKLPPGRKLVGSKWVFKKKTGSDGSVERYKARLVAQGYTQNYRTDYDKIFCPVVRQESLRVFIALSVQNELKLHQVDVTTAFLNGILEE